MADIPTWLSAVADSAVAALAALSVATWRRQLRGNKEHETALRAYRASIRVADSIGEGLQTAKEISAASTPGHLGLISERLAGHMRDAAGELSAAILEVRALWDEETADPLAALLAYQGEWSRLIAVGDRFESRDHAGCRSRLRGGQRTYEGGTR